MALMCGGGGNGGADMSDAEKQANSEFKQVAQQVGKENIKVRSQQPDIRPCMMAPHAEAQMQATFCVQRVWVARPSGF